MTQEETIERLAYYQSEISKIEGKPLSDAAFVKRFLTISSTVFSRFRAGTYAGNAEAVIEKCEADFAEIESRLSQLARNAETGKQFLKTTFAKAVLANVARAKDSADRRVVVALSHTGGGKSVIGHFVESRGGVYVEGRKGWRRCYKAFCADVAAAAGRPIRLVDYGEAVAEREMLAALSSRAGTLYIDEAGFMGGATVDAIKLIVNRTDYTVVLATVPPAWDRLVENATDEVRQIIRRCQPVLRNTDVSESDVRMLADSILGKDTSAESVRIIRKCANTLGLFATVAEICNALRDVESPTLEDVQKECANMHASFAAAGIATGGGK